MSSSASQPTIRKPKRPNASFVFNAQNWLCYAEYSILTAAQAGRLFTKICRAVDERDEAFLAQHPLVVERVYYRDNESSKRPPLAPSLRRAVFDRDGRACVKCGSSYKLEIDHIFPWSKGGKHELTNLRVLCKPCNRRKHNQIEEVGFALGAN